MAEAAPLGDIFVTATGDIHVIRGEHFAAMKDGAIVANTGHFNVEIDIPALEQMAVSRREVRDFVEEFRMADGHRVYLLAEGRLVNLSCAEGASCQCHGHEFRKPSAVGGVPCVTWP